MELGAMIRQRRRELGLTQEEVAMEGQVSKPYLSNIGPGSNEGNSVRGDRQIKSTDSCR